jgi:hypothetical protein
MSTTPPVSVRAAQGVIKLRVQEPDGPVRVRVEQPDEIVVRLAVQMMAPDPVVIKVEPPPPPVPEVVPMTRLDHLKRFLVGG